MKTLRLWLVIFIIVIAWIYFLFISPRLFNNKVLIVPNIINMTEIEGLEHLKESGIKYNVLYLEDNNNNVIKTIPYPNTKIKAHYPIDVYVGKVMPISYQTFLGQVFEDVKEEIEIMCNNNGIKLRVVYELNNDVVDGIIIKESLQNKQVLDGIEELVITVSNNNTKLSMPNFVGKHINEVLSFVENNNLQVIFIYLEVLMIEDIVIYQSISENTVIDKNSNYKIEIYVSKPIA
jgi:beta-lactam-binding protein with PASTA domain